MAKRKTQTRKRKVATRGHINKPKKKVKKIVATQDGDEANNNLEQSPPTVNEDAQKDAAMLGLGEVPEEIKILEAEELASAKGQGESELEALEPVLDFTTDEPGEPFDPKKLIADMLKKKHGA